MMARNISYINKQFSIQPYVDLESPSQISTSKKYYVQRWKTTFLNHIAGKQSSEIMLHVSAVDEDDLQVYIRLLDFISSLVVWLPDNVPMINISSEKIHVVRYAQAQKDENFIFATSREFSRGLVFWDTVPQLLSGDADDEFLGILILSPDAVQKIIDKLNHVYLDKEDVAK